MLKIPLIYLSFFMLMSTCSQQTLTVKPNEINNEKPDYELIEDFENTSGKGAYATGDISSSFGSWNLDDAVIGNLSGDLKNGAKSLRLRNGQVTMNFDLQGVKTVYMKHGKFGNDAPTVWQLLMSSDGGSTFNPVSEEIRETNNVLKLDSFVINTTGKLRLQIRKLDQSAARINIDDIVFKGTGLPGVEVVKRTSNPSTGVKEGSSTNLARGVVFGPDAQPASGDNSNSLFGNPSNASTTSADNFLIDQKYYVESYNSSRGTPNWVSWHLDASSFTGSSKRLDNFAPYSGIPAHAYQVQSSTYKGSGFDKGHNIPSGDRTSSTYANSSTFLMTNIIPQAPLHNQNLWNDLESYLRSKVAQGNEVYVIMGSYGIGGVGNGGLVKTIANGKITVPAYIWKVAVIIPVGDDDLERVSDQTRVIAVHTPNSNQVERDWKKYRVTVRAIEKETGYNLLSNLPQIIQNVIETRVDTAR